MTQYRNDPLDYEPYNPDVAVSQAPAAARNSFIRKTYVHLAGAVLATVAIDAAILGLVPDATLRGLVGAVFSGWMWLVVLGAFMAVSFLANKMAASRTSIAAQYAGLALYTVFQALIFVPLLYVAAMYVGGGVIGTAAIATLIIFATLTAFVWISGYDFSFLRGILMIAGFAALGVIAASIFLGFTLGTLFSGLMIAFAAAYILYDTSNVAKHYPVGMHVAAALALYSSLALLFWYVLRLLMSMRE